MPSSAEELFCQGSINPCPYNPWGSPPLFCKGTFHPDVFSRMQKVPCRTRPKVHHSASNSQPSASGQLIKWSWWLLHIPSGQHSEAILLPLNTVWLTSISPTSVNLSQPFYAWVAHSLYLVAGSSSSLLCSMWKGMSFFSPDPAASHRHRFYCLVRQADK